MLRPDADPSAVPPLPEHDPRAEGYNLIELLAADHSERVVQLDNDALLLVDEATDAYCIENPHDVGRSLYGVMHEFETLECAESRGRDISVSPFIFESHFSVQTCSAALGIAAKAIKRTLYGQCGEATFAVWPPDITAEDALAAWSTDPTLNPNASASDPDHYFSLIRDIYNDHRDRYGQAARSFRQQIAQIGEVYFGGHNGSEVALTILDILPQVEAQTSAITGGDINAVELIEPAPAAGVFTFTQALEIVAKVKGHTYIGAHNGTLLILTPETTVNDALSLWAGDRPS